MIQAYAHGYFPMAESRDEKSLNWYRPPMRGVLPLDGFRISRSFKKFLKKTPYRNTVNQDFSAVIRHCAEVRTHNRTESWINEEIEAVFIELHALGAAHSVETRDEAGNLVGGLYGLALGGAFFGESMFSLRPESSKQALVFLVERLRARGFTLLDTQFVNDHIAQFGVIEMTDEAYQHRLAEALRVKTAFHP